MSLCTKSAELSQLIMIVSCHWYLSTFDCYLYDSKHRRCQLIILTGVLRSEMFTSVPYDFTQRNSNKTHQVLYQYDAYIFPYHCIKGHSNPLTLTRRCICNRYCRFIWNRKHGSTHTVTVSRWPNKCKCACATYDCTIDEQKMARF